MPSEHVDETLLVKYLIGNLTEEEEARVEDQAFADSAYLSALEAAEADLVDAYVRGDLSHADRRGFERRFLMSPRRRGKVEFARALAIVSAEPARPVAEAPVHATLRDLIRSWSPPLRWAPGLAALICVAGVWWLASQNASMQARLAALEAQERGLKQELSQSKSRADDLAAQLQNRQPTEMPRGSLIASLMLMAGPSRAQTPVEEIVIRPDTQLARIDIQLEARDDYPRYRADLHTRSGRDILIQSNLTRRSAGGGYTVSMDVPVSALVSGEYELALSGIANGQEAREIGFYYFRVRKQ